MILLTMIAALSAGTNPKFIGHIFGGKYLDCGSMKGYVKSSIEIPKL